MRKLITGMKLSIDGKMEGAEEMADWVEAWSEDYGLTPEIDACVLGGKMYPGYERYWTGIQNEPNKPAWITARRRRRPRSNGHALPRRPRITFCRAR